jgi:hypothetical protein
VKTFILSTILMFCCSGCAIFQSIPVEFVGIWKTDCSDQDNFLGIQITESQILFWEAVGDIKKVKLLKDGVYDINLDLFSEDQEWNASMQYKVNGATLIQLPSKGIDKIVRFRCKNV